MAEKQLEGGCQCGAVRYRVSGEPVMAALCHCSLAGEAGRCAEGQIERLDNCV